MHPLNPFFSIIIFSIAFFTAYLIKLRYKITFPSGRYETIDGMRGFLALGVFIHHSSIWHQYLQTGAWDAPKSNLYIHFGQTSVSLFFMITSFLFISKLINSAEKGFNWRNFFISRIFRLAPMYYFSVSLIFISVMVISHWHLVVEASDLLKSIFSWGIFTINGIPRINNSQFSAIINAGVVWSLPYEWLFYFSLPMISIFLLKAKPEKLYIVISILFLIVFVILHGKKGYPVYPFLGGAIAPFLLKYTSIDQRVKNNFSSVIILISLFFIGQFNTASDKFCIVLIAVIFTLIALGNSLFGVLKNSTLRFLGDICYSTYLMHGIVIFVVFYFGFGLETVKKMTPLQYCFLVFSITPFVVLISFLGFKFIEKPFMDRSKRIIEKLNINDR